MKECLGCKIKYSFSNFHRHSWNEDGHQKYCKSCRAKQNKKYWDRISPEKRREHYDLWNAYRKTEKGKNTTKEVKRRYLKRHWKECLERGYSWRRRNNEKVVKTRKKYNDSEKGKLTNLIAGHVRRQRLKKSGLRLKPPEWKRILCRQKNKCRICGKIFSKKCIPQMDHIFPISRGGLTIASNIQALCKPCNSKKGNKIDRG
jgi:5-methylcytosine-specific restriction endonuclease McrA